MLSDIQSMIDSFSKVSEKLELEVKRLQRHSIKIKETVLRCDGGCNGSYSKPCLCKDYKQCWNNSRDRQTRVTHELYSCQDKLCSSCLNRVKGALKKINDKIDIKYNKIDALIDLVRSLKKVKDVSIMKKLLHD